MQLNLEKLIIGNGAGSIKHLDEVKRAAKSPMTRITVGSITAKAREGNVGDVYYYHPQEQWSLNSLGLPNRGMTVYSQLLPEMVKIAHGSGKQLWASISPFSPEECGQMADDCLVCGVDGVEINGSCPNVWNNGRRKAIPALDPSAAAEMFQVVGLYIGSMEQVSFKLSPTTDRELLIKLAKVCGEYQVEQLVCCNAKPDQEGTRVDGKPALAFRASEQDPEFKHLGGRGGHPSLEENLWVTRVMRDYLPRATLIGIGGIFTGADAELYLQSGATGIQSTTGYVEFKEQLFVDILMYLAEKVSA